MMAKQPQRTNPAEKRLWSACRVLRHNIEPPLLAIIAQVGDRRAAAYCRALERLGVLICDRPSNQRHGIGPRYRLRTGAGRRPAAWPPEMTAASEAAQ